MRTTQTPLLQAVWCVLKAFDENEFKQAGYVISGLADAFLEVVLVTLILVEKLRCTIEGNPWKKIKPSITSPRGDVSPKRANLTLQTFPRKIPSSRKGSTSSLHAEKNSNFAVFFARWADLNCTGIHRCRDAARILHRYSLKKKQLIKPSSCYLYFGVSWKSYSDCQPQYHR